MTYNGVYSQKKCLIIDDEEMLRETLREEFEDCGSIVTLASSGKDALSFIEKQDFDFILCDVKMPNGSGDWLIKEMKSKKIKIPPFFICSGYKVFSQEEMKDLGILESFKKPFETDEMIEIIANHLK